MRRVLEFCQRAIQRVNARIAILVIVVVAGGVAAWQGFAHMAVSPKGPKKQIATGVQPQNAAGIPAVHPAVASLTDEQLPAAGGSGSHRLMAYGQPADSTPAVSVGASQPPTSPYLPTAGDPGGGYAPSLRYAAGGRQSGQYGEGGQPRTAPPADPTAVQPVSDVPGNPYREGATAHPADAASGYALNATEGYARNATQGAAYSVSTRQSPYAGAAESPGYGGAATNEQAPTINSTADLTPAADAASAYANRVGRGGAAAIDAPPGQLPPNTLPDTKLSSNPSAAVAQGLRSLSSSGTSSLGGVGGLSPTRSNANDPQPAALRRGEGAGRLAAPTPGERQWEGPQQPAILLEKASPAEIQVGKPATFELYVRNAGQVPAQQVVVTDHVPAGTQLLDAKPQPQQASDGSLVWSLGTIQPGEETQITLHVMPQTEGEIGSTAHVSFAAAATSRSICTRPQLTIEHTAPPKVLIGESLTVGITISNPGSGPATGVIVEEDVPDGLKHVAGAQLEYEVGTLRPGESKHLELSLRADKPGVIQNTILVHGEGNLAARHTVQLEVVAPQLQVAVEGPKLRFLERQATYTLQVANAGTAAARDVELVAFLPRGMKFVAADSQGQYDPGQHAVFWSLAELPPAKAGPVKLTLLPVEPGEQRLRIEGRAGLGLTAAGEQIVQVEQAAELLHTVKDTDEVIEVGSETTYEIRVTNRGTKAATNVRIAAFIPAGMAAVGGEGPTRAGGDATQVVFEPLARLNPQEEVIYKAQVQGRQPGDHIVRVQLSCDEWPTPVTREESTRVYLDR